MILIDVSLVWSWLFFLDKSQGVHYLTVGAVYRLFRLDAVFSGDREVSSCKGIVDNPAFVLEQKDRVVYNTRNHQNGGLLCMKLLSIK